MPSRTVIKGGTLITMDPHLGDLTGDILVEDDRIVRVAPSINVEPGTLEIDATNHIVIPGFIDTHRHLYQAALRGMSANWSLMQYCVAMFGTLGHVFTPRDMYLGNYLGSLDALDSGVTSVFDWSHNQLTPEHSDRLVDGIHDAGIRAMFGYGASMKEWAECLTPPYRSTAFTPEDEVRRLNRNLESHPLISLGLAARGPDLSVMEVVEADWRLARELGIRINAHVGQGIFPGRPAVSPLHEAGLLGDDVTFGHCNLLTDDEMKMMADAGVTATVTPEDESSMGHGIPPIVRLVNAGVATNIGVDTCIIVGGDQFSAMRFALAVPRAVDNQVVLDGGENPWDLQLTARQVLEMATIEGARALGMVDSIGSITEGKQADLVLIRTNDVSMVPVLDPVATVVNHAGRSVVDHVFVAGKQVKRDGRLVAANQAEPLFEEMNAAAQAILQRANVTVGWTPPAG